MIDYDISTAINRFMHAHVRFEVTSFQNIITIITF